MKCSEGFSNRVSNIIRRYTDHMQFAAYVAVGLSHSFGSTFLSLCIRLYVFMSRLCILIVMYVLFCILCYHRANWHSSATLTEVFPCIFVSCKSNARV